MSLSLVDIRVQSRIDGRNAHDPQYYPDAQIDSAAMFLFTRFLRVTSAVKTFSTITLTASTNLADFSALSGFLASRIERARLDVDTNYTEVDESLGITSADEVYDRIAGNSSTGTPSFMGFISSTSAKFYPTPAYNGTLSVRWCPLQTSWQLGSQGAWSSAVNYYVGDLVSSGGTIYRSLIHNNLNLAVGTTANWQNLGTGTLTAPASITTTIPDGLVSEIISTGISAALQRTDPEHQGVVGPQWQSYLEFERSCMGIGSVSGKSIQRETL